MPPDEVVNITVDVSNTGESDGVYTVTLKINGVVEDTRSVSLGGNQTVQVTFTVTKSETGNYTVEIDGQSAVFSVSEPIQLILIAEVIGGVIVLALIIFFARRLLLLKKGY